MSAARSRSAQIAQKSAQNLADNNLRQAVKKSGRKARFMALALASPLLLYLLLTFVAPVVVIMLTAWRNPEPTQFLPKFYQALAAHPWTASDTTPAEPVMAALAEELAQAEREHTLGQLAKRLNYEVPGLRSKLSEAARMAESVLHPKTPEMGGESTESLDGDDILAAMLASSEDAPKKPKKSEKPAKKFPENKLNAAPSPPPEKTWRDRFLELDPIWGEAATWAVLQRNQSAVTPYYSLTALDLKRAPSGDLAVADPDQAIFLRILGRTLWIASLVTLATLLLGFPVAYVLTVAPARWRGILMLLVLLPLWTSLLVRTTAWVVLLQSEGVINAFLLSTGMVTERVQMIFTRFGTLVAMTHIQLPFTLLPIYSVMRTIGGAQLRAARSLGAPPLVAWWRIYAPQTLPGVVAGGLMTFILSLAYYITPALVGGPNDQMMSNFIATFINRDLNWGMAAALSSVLLVVILTLYWVFLRLVGWERIRLG